jgi:coenzyme F420 hydrogenase subunit beta
MMRRHDSLQAVVDRHLCMGCGACAAARPDLVAMVDTQQHGRRPQIKAGVDPAATRSLLEVCPGREIRFRPARDYDEAAWGPVLEVWEGHALDPELRYRGSSGGVVSALALHAIESESVAGAVQVAARKDQPLLNETIISRSRADVLAASASRYSPASPCERLADVREDGRKHMFIGKPCDVAGAQRLMRSDHKLRNSIGLTVSIFCAGTPSQAATKELIRALDIGADATVEEVRYRGRGWPGPMAVRYRKPASAAPETASMTYAEGWGQILQKHTQWRCRMCADHLGEHADLSVGDPWYRPPGEDEPGESLIVVRSERGRRALRAAVTAGYLALERRSVATLAASQPNLERTKGAVFGRCLTARVIGAAYPLYRGGALHRVWWRALSPVAKAQSLIGTIKRIFRKRILQPERARELVLDSE